MSVALQRARQGPEALLVAHVAFNVEVRERAAAGEALADQLDGGIGESAEGQVERGQRGAVVHGQCEEAARLLAHRGARKAKARNAAVALVRHGCAQGPDDVVREMIAAEQQRLQRAHLALTTRGGCRRRDAREACLGARSPTHRARGAFPRAACPGRARSVRAAGSAELHGLALASCACCGRQRRRRRSRRGGASLRIAPG
mmetsp:Transcript_24581/g.76597  ORF Transcript_24581/g.76597 Transcript_24581/m.76597 type:complete len:202 (-) Transcript_24581:4579-5184(-)